MREPPSLSQLFAAAVEARDCADAVPMALEAHAQCAEMLAAWGAEVDRLAPVVTVDAKDLKRHRKVFEDPRSLQLLQTVWGDSDHVDIADLDLAGLSKKFAPGELTCHRLAMELVRKPEDVPGKVKEVKRIIDAAAVFGLVVIEEVAVNRKPIAGTALLHQTLVRMTKPIEAPVYPMLSIAASEAPR